MSAVLDDVLPVIATVNGTPRGSRPRPKRSGARFTRPRPAIWGSPVC
jgi:hypothetical protein